MNCRAQLITLLFSELVVGSAWLGDAPAAYWAAFFSAIAAMVYLLITLRVARDPEIDVERSQREAKSWTVSFTLLSLSLIAGALFAWHRWFGALLFQIGVLFVANYADRFRSEPSGLLTRPVQRPLGFCGSVIWTLSAFLSYLILTWHCVSGGIANAFFTEACTNINYLSNHLPPLIAVLGHLLIVALSTFKRLRSDQHSSAYYGIWMYFLWFWIGSVIGFSLWARRPFVNGILCWTGLALFTSLSGFAMDFFLIPHETVPREERRAIARESQISTALPQMESYIAATVVTYEGPPPTVPVQPVIVQVVEPCPHISEPSLAAYYELKDPDLPLPQIYSPIANEPSAELEEELPVGMAEPRNADKYMFFLVSICATIAFIRTFPLSGMYVVPIEELFVDFAATSVSLCAVGVGFSKPISFWLGAQWCYRQASDALQFLVITFLALGCTFLLPSYLLRGIVPDQWRFCIATFIGIAGFALLTFTPIGFERLRICLSLRICGRDPWTTPRTSIPYEAPPSTPLQTWLRTQKIEQVRRRAAALFISLGAFRLIVIGSLDCSDGCGWMSAHGRKCMTLGWMLLWGDLISPLGALLSLPRRKGIASLVVVASIIFCSALHIGMIGVDDIWGPSVAIAVASIASLYSFAMSVVVDYQGIPFFRSLPSLPLTLTEELVASLPPVDNSPNPEQPSEWEDIPRDPRPTIRQLKLASHNCEYVQLPNISTSSGCAIIASTIIIAIAVVVSGFCVNFELPNDLNPGMSGFVDAIGILTVLLLFGLAVLRVCFRAIEGTLHDNLLRCVGGIFLWVTIIIFALIDPLWGVRWRPLNTAILVCVGLFVLAVVVRRIWPKAAYPNAHSDQRSLIGVSDFSIALLVCIIWTNIIAFQTIVDLQQTILRLVMVSFIWAGVVGLTGPFQYPEYPEAEPERGIVALPVLLA